jgi:predicted DNA-binding ribbon-helix-helix protein
MEKYRTTRLWDKTLQKLRIIAAWTNTSIVQVIDRLADEEMQRLHIPQERRTQDEQKK